MSVTKLLVILVVLFGMVPGVQASLIQIDDRTDSLKLYVDGSLITADGGQISGYSNTVVGPATGGMEILTFTFQSTNPWSGTGDFKYYTLMSSPIDITPTNPDGLSDIYLIQGTGGSYLDVITFISSDDPLDLAIPSGFIASSFNPLIENGTYQTVFETYGITSGLLVDRYQVASDVPEPATLVLFGNALLGILGYGWRRRI